MHDSARHVTAVGGSNAIAYKIPEAARQLSISTRQLYRLIRAGDIPTVPVGAASTRVLHEDLVAYLKRQRERQTTSKAA